MTCTCGDVPWWAWPRASARPGRKQTHPSATLRTVSQSAVTSQILWSHGKLSLDRGSQLSQEVMNNLSRLCACLLNVSEARNRNIVQAIANSALKINTDKCTNIAVLNVFSDYDYNRSVITIAGSAEHIGESVVSACETAFHHIDIGQHSGGHPRLGSVDLVPIHPLSSELSLPECGQIARGIAKKITSIVPGTSMFFFGHADEPNKRGLVERRKEVRWYVGGHGSDKNMVYDVGSAPSKRYGLTGIGAIPYVMNCNVTIETSDLAFGKEVAASIRASTPGGLPGVQSMAFHHKGDIEIACNVEAISVTETQLSEEHRESMIHSFGSYYYVPGIVIEDRVRSLASQQGIPTKGTALVGFSPDEAKRLATQAISDNIPKFWQTRNLIQM